MIDPELAQQIFTITRGDLDLDSAVFTLPRFGSELDGLSFARLGRMSRFWEGPDRRRGRSLEQGTLDLITGLFGHGGSWMYVLKATPGQIECWYGLPSARTTSEAWLSGAFPGVSLSPTGPRSIG